MRWLSSLSIAIPMLVACGGSTDEDDDGVGAASGLDRNARITTLDETEMGVLCDWVSARLGGYGVERDCGEMTARTTANQEECVQSTQNVTADCAATVGQYEDCANALGGNICGLLTEPACQPLFSCV
jgi:hypothetical protein